MRFKDKYFLQIVLKVVNVVRRVLVLFDKWSCAPSGNYLVVRLPYEHLKRKCKDKLKFSSRPA